MKTTSFLTVTLCAVCLLFAGSLAASAADDGPAPQPASLTAEAPAAPISEQPAASAEGDKECALAEPELTSEVVPVSTCIDCDTAQGYCTPGDNRPCWTFCRQLVGEIGFCHQECACCVCPP